MTPTGAPKGRLRTADFHVRTGPGDALADLRSGKVRPDRFKRSTTRIRGRVEKGREGEVLTLSERIAIPLNALPADRPTLRVRKAMRMHRPA